MCSKREGRDIDELEIWSFIGEIGMLLIEIRMLKERISLMG